jgi:hypothetical protein
VLVTLDLLRSTEDAPATQAVVHDHRSQSIAAAQDTK